MFTSKWNRTVLLGALALLLAVISIEPATVLFHEALEAGQSSWESGHEVLVTWAGPDGVSTWPLGGSLSRGLLPDPLPPQARFLATPPVASPAERWLGRAEAAARQDVQRLARRLA